MIAVLFSWLIITDTCHVIFYYTKVLYRRGINFEHSLVVEYSNTRIHVLDVDDRDICKFYSIVYTDCVLLVRFMTFFVILLVKILFF